MGEGRALSRYWRLSRRRWCCWRWYWRWCWRWRRYRRDGVRGGVTARVAALAACVVAAVMLWAVPWAAHATVLPTLHSKTVPAIRAPATPGAAAVRGRLPTHRTALPPPPSRHTRLFRTLVAASAVTANLRAGLLRTPRRPGRTTPPLASLQTHDPGGGGRGGRGSGGRTGGAPRSSPAAHEPPPWSGRSWRRRRASPCTRAPSRMPLPVRPTPPASYANTAYQIHTRRQHPHSRCAPPPPTACAMSSAIAKRHHALLRTTFNRLPRSALTSRAYLS